MKAIDWTKKVADDYRERILVDADSPILAFKANRDRYTDIKNQADYAGLPHLGSFHSEDALTWNVFRSLQKYGRLNIITEELSIGDPRGMLLWTIATESDETSCKLQYATGSIIRKFDGRLPGQISEPDVIILGSKRLAKIECKLSEPDKMPSHMWEGTLDSVKKRRQIYEKEFPGLIKEFTSDEAIVPVYQLIRMAFYSLKIAETFAVEPILVSLVNERNWEIETHKFGKSSHELWNEFCNRILGTKSLPCKSLTWQNLRKLLQDQTPEDLSLYLSTRPCI